MKTDPETRSAVARARGGARPQGGEALTQWREKVLARGVIMPFYLLVRVVLVPFFKLYFRLEGFGGGGRLPRSGPLLLACNHRSFLDPFIIGALMKRPVYYVAKRELFERRWQGMLIGGLGAFPIDRGRSDEEAMATAKTILQRGDCVLIFPEGTRVRPGPLGAPRRGVGRLALETGAPVVPIAALGTEDVRSGWRIRPRKVRVRFGRPMSFPQTTDISPSLAAGVTARIWACVGLQWAWLGGEVPAPVEPMEPSLGMAAGASGPIGAEARPILQTERQAQRRVAPAEREPAGDRLP